MTTLAQTGTITKRTALVSVAAIALTIGVTSWFVHFAPAFAQELTSVSEPRSETGDGIGTGSASRKVQCIMPPAWRRACEQ